MGCYCSVQSTQQLHCWHSVLAIAAAASLPHALLLLPHDLVFLATGLVDMMLLMPCFLVTSAAGAGMWLLLCLAPAHPRRQHIGAGLRGVALVGLGLWQPATRGLVAATKCATKDWINQ